MAISKEFVIAGNATFTIETPEGHRTYKVEYVEASERWKESWFVKLLVGPDNGSDYAYVGKLNDFTGQIMLTSKSRLTADAYPIRLFNRVVARIWANDHNAYEQHGYHTHHEGKCGRCGRKLTVPESVTSGIGPECRKHMTILPNQAIINQLEDEINAQLS